MSNSPFGQLPIDSTKTRSKFQKLNALLAYATAYATKFKQTFQLSHKHYGAALFLDLVILVLVVVFGGKGAVDLISPWVSKLQTPVTYQNLKNHKLFAFAPGWSSKKLAQVRLDNLSTLAFFDIAINKDGTLNLDNSGYQNFKGEVASELFVKAQEKGVKVVVTLSQVDKGDITNILNDPAAQQNIIFQAIEEVKDSKVDGVAVDFEYRGEASGDLKDKYSLFIKNFADQMHREIPNSIVNVAIPDSLSQSSIYNLAALSKVADKVLMIAYNTAVPETVVSTVVSTKNASIISPIFAGDANVFFQKLSFSMAGTQALAADKIQMEVAWYGNGENYPLYIPKSEPANTPGVENSLQTPLSDQMIDSLVSEVPDKAKNAARRNLPYIAKALEGEGILNQHVLAYALATVEHETAGTFEPIEEIKGRKSARRLGYEGGTDYFGRGFIQLTHLRNYKKIGARIGLGDQLVQNPELASNPEVAAKILAVFFKDNNVANLASDGNFIAARDPVNPDYWAYYIARIALRYLYSIG